MYYFCERCGSLEIDYIQYLSGIKFKCRSCDYEYYPKSNFDQGEKEVINMKKSDLKTGMLVKTRGGERLIVFLNSCGGEDYLVDNTHAYLNLASYSDDLIIFPKNVFFDIKTIYGFIDGNRRSSYFSFSIEKRKILWDRKEEYLVTMQQIADKFGINVENLKIKK
jgi:hypothetical protein